MKSHSRKWIVLSLIATTSLLNGCALFSPNMTEEEMYENDPVGRAALSLRQDRSPASEISYSAAAPDNREMPADAAPNVPLDQLTLGMSTYRVQALWGQPQDIETAGDPSQGNQRWTYLNGLKRGWGTSDYRVVYFERNQVVGWENHR